MLAMMNYPPGYRATATRSYHRPPAKATSRQKLRPSQSRPLDPNELTRRLSIVVAEQKAHSERKKRARAEADRRARQCPSGTDTGKDKGKDKDAAPLAAVKEKSPNGPTKQYKANDKHNEEPQKARPERTATKTPTASRHNEGEDGHSSSYRHIPQVAASQFARTTTVESPTERLQVHKLSKKAMKFHMQGPNANHEICTAGPDASPFEQARALRRAQGMRERQYERNKSHHMPTLATTAEVDEKQDRLPHRHTFGTHFKFKVKGMDFDDMKDPRRRSTGSILGRTEPPPVGSFEFPAGLIPVERRESDETVHDPSEHHRVDWTQSDEARARPMPIATSPPPLRKHESRWTLRGRLGSFTKHGKDDKPPTPPDEKASQDSPRSPKAGFFARFKR